VRGGIRSEEGAPPKVSVSEIVPLDVARVALPAQVSITLRLGNGNGNGDGAANGGNAIERLHELCERKPGDTDVPAHGRLIMTTGDPQRCGCNQMKSLLKEKDICPFPIIN
jgi:hypothetical protein